MKTVADFKRALKVGTQMHTIYHKEFSHRDESGKVFYKDKDLGTRPVSIVQSTQFALLTTRTDGKQVSSYCNFPKATECQIEGNTIVIFVDQGRGEGQQKVLTYTILQDEAN